MYSSKVASLPSEEETKTVPKSTQAYPSHLLLKSLGQSLKKKHALKYKRMLTNRTGSYPSRLDCKN